MKIKIDSIYPINLDVSTPEGKEFLIGGVDVNFTVYYGLTELSGSTRFEHDGGHLVFFKDLTKAIETLLKGQLK